MVDFVESDKMLKISGKEDMLNPYNVFNDNISFFINGRTLSDETFFEFFYILAIAGIDKTGENVKWSKDKREKSEE